jgi:predicted Zn-dependent protease
MKFSGSMLLALTASWGAFAGVFTMVTSCRTSAPQASAPAGAQLSPEEQKKLEEYRAEIEIGRNMAGRLLAFYGTNGDERLRGYVNQVGNYVASYSDYPDRKYMFAILDTEAVNAFACPGGYILVTQGAIRRAKNEAELGMILGHEVAHVGRQHMFNTLKAMDEEQAKKTAAEGERVTEIPESMRMRKRPVPEEVEGVKKLTRYLGSSQVAGIGILQAAKAGMSLILEKGLDQKLEYEADREGVKYAVRAGYDPDALKDFLARLEERARKAKKAGTSTGDMGKTHPSTGERIARIESLLKDVLNADEIVGATGAQRFEKIHKRLPAEGS